MFYPGRIFTLEDCSEGETKVYGWRIVITNNSRIITEEVPGSQFSMTLPQCNSLNVEAITERYPVGISTFTHDDLSSDIYDLNGRKVNSASSVSAISSVDNLPHGIYIIRGRKVVK